MNLVQGRFWQTLVLTTAGACLLSSCHHGSSSAATAIAQYTISVSVSGLAGSGLVLVNNGIDSLTVTGSGVATFSTSIGNFSTYAVQVLTQPSAPAQICSVINGIGIVEGAAVTVAVSCGTVGTQVGRFAYVVNSISGSLSGYAISSTTGALTELTGSPLAIPGAVSLRQALIDPSGSFLYVIDSGANKLYAYKINQSAGGVNVVSGSPFATGNTPVSMTFDYTGTYLYVANSADNTISAYTLTIATGELAAMTGSPFGISGVDPSPRQILASGPFLFAVNFNTNSVNVFSIGTGTGVLHELSNGSPYATDTGPYSLAIDPTGSVLYTANTGPASAGSITAFTLDLSSGVLTPVAGNPFAIPVINNITIDSKSKYLFVPETAGVAVYPIVNRAVGGLSAPVAGSPFATGTNPYSVTLDVADEFVYVANQGSADVSEFTFLPATGVLSAVAGSPVTSQLGPVSIQIQ
jgi:6-phosphogluconolactonase (cycloisomerase 2 family)